MGEVERVVAPSNGAGQATSRGRQGSASLDRTIYSVRKVNGNARSTGSYLLVDPTSTRWERTEIVGTGPWAETIRHMSHITERLTPLGPSAVAVQAIQSLKALSFPQIGAQKGRNGVSWLELGVELVRKDVPIL